MHVCIHQNVHAIHVNIQTKHTCIYANKHTFIHVSKHVYILTYIDTDKHACIQTYRCTDKRKDLHIHLLTHTHAHVYTYTHIHTNSDCWIICRTRAVLFLKIWWSWWLMRPIAFLSKVMRFLYFAIFPSIFSGTSGFVCSFPSKHEFYVVGCRSRISFHMCDMTHLYVRHGSFICATGSFICAPWLIRGSDRTLFLRGLISMIDMSPQITCSPTVIRMRSLAYKRKSLFLRMRCWILSYIYFTRICVVTQFSCLCKCEYMWFAVKFAKREACLGKIFKSWCATSWRRCMDAFRCRSLSAEESLNSWLFSGKRNKARPCILSSVSFYACTLIAFDVSFDDCRFRGRDARNPQAAAKTTTGAYLIIFVCVRLCVCKYTCIYIYIYIYV